MNTDISFMEAVKLLWPLIVLHFGLAIWSIVDISRRERVKYLPKIAWVVIVIFVQMFGSIIYLTVGRSE